MLPFTRASVVSFIQRQPVRKIGGIGKVMEKILAAVGVTTGADLFAHRVELVHVFSDKTAPWLLRTSLGIEEARESTGRKSFSRERTFANLSEPAALELMCRKVCGYLAADLQEAGVGCHTLTLKLKSADFSVRQRSVSFATLLKSEDDLAVNALAVLHKELPLTLRLLGVRASGLVTLSEEATTSSKQRQLDIDRFATAGSTKAVGASASARDAGSDGRGDEDLSDSRVVVAEDDTEPTAQLDARKARRKRDGTSIAGFVAMFAKDTTSDIVATMLETSTVGVPDLDADSNMSVSSVAEDAHFDDASFQACPICGKLINVSNAIAINSHVDACIHKQTRRAATGSVRVRTSSGSSRKRGAVRASSHGGRQRSDLYVPNVAAAACFQPCPVCGELINASSSQLVNTHIDACVLTPLSQPTPESPTAAVRAATLESESESRCPICSVPVDASNSVAVNKHIDACVARQSREENGRTAGALHPHAAGSITRGSERGSKRRRRGGEAGGGQQQHSIHSFFASGGT